MTTESDALKRAAAEKALEQVQSGMILGLGTGSTVAHFLELLGQALQDGSLTEIVGVPTSVRTGREARQAGIELAGLADHARIHLMVDGADEIAPDLSLIKGMGGALLREKMVAQASSRVLIIADESKVVERLGTVSPLPVEVVDWGWGVHSAFLESRGAKVTVRSMEDGPPFKSDNGNLLLDCRFPGGIDDPAELNQALLGRSGVLETGLFLGLADEALVAGADGVRVLRSD